MYLMYALVPHGLDKSMQSNSNVFMTKGGCFFAYLTLQSGFVGLQQNESI